MTGGMQVGCFFETMSMVYKRFQKLSRVSYHISGKHYFCLNYKHYLDAK